MARLKPTAHAGVTLVVGLLLGLGLGSTGTAVWGQREAVPRINPQERTLDANLFMQTSAEYVACCLQTYAWASERLRQRLAALPPSERPPAVVLDLDETVLDNAGFQSFLDREGKSYEKPSGTAGSESSLRKRASFPAPKASLKKPNAPA